jgi:hypothetical protein
MERNEEKMRYIPEETLRSRINSSLEDAERCLENAEGATGMATKMSILADAHTHIEDARRFRDQLLEQQANPGIGIPDPGPFQSTTWEEVAERYARRMVIDKKTGAAENYCCEKMAKRWRNFAVTPHLLPGNIMYHYTFTSEGPALLTRNNGAGWIRISFCPFCGAELVVE